MADIKKLLEGYNLFKKKYYDISDTLYKKLEYKQSPKTLIISCCDSRVDPAILTNSDPGDIFVVRNIANLVPPFEPKWDSKHGTSAALEFAVNVLNVENIIVLGHSNCGGIEALVKSFKNDFTNLNFVQGWINISSHLKNTIPNSLDYQDVCKYCELESIKGSLKNLLSFPFIKKRVDDNFLSLYGWYFDIKDGSLYALNSANEDFIKQ